MNDLYKAFHKYFEVVIADTPSLLEVVFRMRYQKLCIDMSVPGYESSLYPDGQEKDNYDDHSSHVLIRHRQTNEYIGTTRLIMFDKKTQRNCSLLNGMHWLILIFIRRMNTHVNIRVRFLVF